MKREKYLVRGLSLNNPFYIKLSSHPWYGKIQSLDYDFETFSNLGLGIRAGLKTMIHEILKGNNTPYKLVKALYPDYIKSSLDIMVRFVVYNNRNLRYMLPDECITSISAFCLLASRIIKYQCCLDQSELYGYKLSSSDMRYYLNKYNLLSKYPDLFNL